MSTSEFSNKVSNEYIRSKEHLLELQKKFPDNILLEYCLKKLKGTPEVKHLEILRYFAVPNNISQAKLDQASDVVLKQQEKTESLEFSNTTQGRNCIENTFKQALVHATSLDGLDIISGLYSKIIPLWHEDHRAVLVTEIWKWFRLLQTEADHLGSIQGIKLLFGPVTNGNVCQDIFQLTFQLLVRHFIDYSYIYWVCFSDLLIHKRIQLQRHDEIRKLFTNPEKLIRNFIESNLNLINEPESVESEEVWCKLESAYSPNQKDHG